MPGVPQTGSLLMSKLARERYYGNYDGGGTIGTPATSPISMFNLVLGGNTGGGATSGLNYPAPNQSSPTLLPAPPPNPIPEVSFADFRGYVQLTARFAFQFIYQASTAMPPCPLGIPSGTVYYHTGSAFIPVANGTETVYQGAAPNTTVAPNGYYSMYTNPGSGFPAFVGQWLQVSGGNGAITATGSC